MTRSEYPSPKADALIEKSHSVPPPKTPVVTTRFLLVVQRLVERTGVVCSYAVDSNPPSVPESMPKRETETERKSKLMYMKTNKRGHSSSFS